MADVFEDHPIPQRERPRLWELIAQARPLDLAWARSLRDACQAAGVAFHFKQIGGRTHAAGGRLLDGREWSAVPSGAG